MCRSYNLDLKDLILSVTNVFSVTIGFIANKFEKTRLYKSIAFLYESVSITILKIAKFKSRLRIRLNLDWGGGLDNSPPRFFRIIPK